MKKLTTIFLCFSILFSTLGIRLNVDYCPMKESYSFSFSGVHKCCCDKPGKKSCCKSQKIVFKKIEDDYVASGFHLVIPQMQVVGILTNHIKVSNQILVGEDANQMLQNSKPPDLPVSRNILYRSILV